MGEFGKTASEIIFEYKSNYADNNWVALEPRQSGEVTISKVFHFKIADLVEDLLPPDDDHAGYVYRFRFAGFGDKPQFNPVAACLECCTIDR